ncbi:MAG: hypothetical protein HZC36_09530 [Armatimonadetes bacterium]|nr:hypothetical protein [Armatimonadota bacterium]
MSSVSLVATLLALVGFQHNWNGPYDYTCSGKQNGHTYSVKFHVEDFKLRGRKVLWVPLQGTDGLYLPGFLDGKKKRLFFGYDGYSREEIAVKSALHTLKTASELVSLEVSVNGKMWSVSKFLYNDLINPNLGQEYVTASISKDGRTLNISMKGSDAGGSYTVKWKVRQNGKSSRTISDDC